MKIYVDNVMEEYYFGQIPNMIKSLPIPVYEHVSVFEETVDPKLQKLYDVYSFLTQQFSHDSICDSLYMFINGEKSYQEVKNQILLFHSLIEKSKECIYSYPQRNDSKSYYSQNMHHFLTFYESFVKSQLK